MKSRDRVLGTTLDVGPAPTQRMEDGMNTKRMTLGVLGMMGMAMGLLGCVGQAVDEDADIDGAGADIDGAGADSASPAPEQGAPQGDVSDASTTYGSGASGSAAYHNGVLIDSVQLISVFWGSDVSHQSGLDDFYDDIVDSSYMGIIAEYATSMYPISRGTHPISVLVYSDPPNDVTDDQIQAKLSTLIDSGFLLGVGNDALFMVHLPPGITAVKSDGTKSCKVWCGYHSHYSHSGLNVSYAVIADMGGGCASGCGGNASGSFDRSTVVASHELAEAITDPRGSGGWYTSAGEEIGDLCNGVTGSPTVNAGSSSILTLTIAGSVSPGPYGFTVTGDAPSGTHVAPGAVVVQ